MCVECGRLVDCQYGNPPGEIDNLSRMNAEMEEQYLSELEDANASVAVDESPSDGSDALVIVIDREALRRGEVRIRSYGHDARDMTLCMLCKDRDGCDKDTVGKPCMTWCG